MSGKNETGKTSQHVKERLHRERLARSRRSKNAGGGDEAKLAWIERAMNVDSKGAAAPFKAKGRSPSPSARAVEATPRTASPARSAGASPARSRPPPVCDKAGPSDHQRYHGALTSLVSVWEHRVALRIVALWRRNMAITKMRQARRKPASARKAVVAELPAAVPEDDAKSRRRGSGNWTAPAGSKGGPVAPAGSKGGPAWVAPAGSKGGPAIGSDRAIAKAMSSGPTYLASMQRLGDILYGWALQYINRLVRKWRAAIVAKKMLKGRGARDKPVVVARQVRAPAVKPDVSAIEARRHQAEDKMHQLELRRLRDELTAAKAALAYEVESCSTLASQIHQLEESLHHCESGRADLTRELQTLKSRMLKMSKLEMKVAELEAEIQLLRSQNVDLRHQNVQLARYEEEAHTLRPQCGALEKENQELRLDLDMERSRNAELAEIADECDNLKHKANQCERENHALNIELKDLRRYQDECAGLREDYNNVLAAHVQADDALNSTQKALDKSNHALGLTRDALSHSRREADNLKDSLNESKMTCEDLEAELVGTGADEGLLAEENQRLQADLERVLRDLEQVQDDNQALHKQLAGGTALAEEVKSLKRQLHHAEDKLRKNHAVDNSQLDNLQHQLKAQQSELNLAEQKFQTELVQHQHTADELRAAQNQLGSNLRSPEVEIVAPVSPGADSSPEAAELRSELKEANHALKQANKQIRSLSRSNSPAKVRSTGAEELEKARLQHELNTALNELATTPRGSPMPNKADVIMEGHLKKHGNFTWNERWATLDGCYFRVHNNQGDVKPKYVIPLHRLKSVQKQGDHKFTVIHMDGDSLEMDADDKKTCQAWLQAFRTAKDIAKGDNNVMSLEPLTPSRIDQEPLHTFQQRFVELMVEHGNHKIDRLSDMHKTGASAAEASLWVGWCDNDGDECHEERTVMTILTPKRAGGKGGHDVQPCAMMCFNFSDKAQSLRLELDLPSEYAAEHEDSEPDSPVHVVQTHSEPVLHAAPVSHAAPVAEPKFLHPQDTKMEVHRQSEPADKHSDDDNQEGIDEEDLQAVFELFDVEQSGEITMGEMGDAMEALGLDVSEGQVERIFASVDKDSDGTIDFPEFCQVINGNIETSGDGGNNFETDDQVMREVFDLFDTDGSGQIDLRELGDAMEALGIRTSPELVEHTMHNVDSSEDGLIDFAEFCQVLSPHMADEKGKSGSGDANAEQLGLIQEAFEVFDLDRSGIINAADLGDAMEALGLEVTDEEANDLLRGCGKQPHEVLVIDEFTMIVLPLWKNRISFPDVDF